MKKNWSGRPGSNRRHSAWEADVLPLNYSRRVGMANVMKYISTVHDCSTEHIGLCHAYRAIARSTISPIIWV